MNRVIVIGSNNIDIVATTKRLPRSGEVVVASSVAFLPGGVGANQAVAAARAGANTLMVSAIGDDDSARTIQHFLEDESIDISNIKPVPGPSGTALVVVDDRGENTIVIVAGANTAIDEQQIKRIKFTDTDIILLQNEIPEASVHAAITAAHAAGATIIYNASPFRAMPSELMNKINYLIVNEVEFIDFARIPGDLITPESLELKLSSSVPEPVNVIITLGRDGLCARLGKKIYRLPGHKVPVVDTTGAGDCFAGSFGAALAKAVSPADALGFANAAASLSVQKPGAGPSMPRLADIEKFLKAGV